MEETSHIAHYMYELEIAYLEGETLVEQKKYIQGLQEKGKFPPDLELLDFMYDGAQGSNTGTSGAAFRDKRSGKIYIGYTGTNPKQGGEFRKDLGTDFVDIGGSQGRHYKPSIDFFKKIGDQYADGNYKSMVPVGHSLSGSIGVRVAYEFNTELTVVYNPAALKVGGWAQDIVLKSRAAQLLREHIKKHNPERLPTFMPNSMTDEEKAILDREYQKLKRQADEQQKYIAEREKHFTGRIVRIHTQSDWLTGSMFLSGGAYVKTSEEYIFTGAGVHGLDPLLETPFQKRIQDIINKDPEEMKVQEIIKMRRRNRPVEYVGDIV